LDKSCFGLCALDVLCESSSLPEPVKGHRVDVASCDFTAIIMATRVHTGDEQFEEEHGRYAERPSEIPKRGWLDIALRVKDEVSKDNVSLIAAGLALYALLAIFPALTAAVSIYGLFASPQQMADHMQSFQGVMPGQATQILEGQMQTLAQQRQTDRKSVV